MTLPSPIVHAALLQFEATSMGPGAPVGDPIQFQFNPKDYTVTKAAKWEAKPAKGAAAAPMPEFKGANPQTMTIICFLDATDQPDHDITGYVTALFNCCLPQPDSLTKNQPSPPFVVFAWGQNFSAVCCVQTVAVQYTMFRPDGTPTRATATITLQEVPSQAAKQNPTSGGLDIRSSRTVVAGDSLQSISTAEYGGPAQWRAIALANRIADPLRVPAGTRLLLPTPEEALELS